MVAAEPDNSEHIPLRRVWPNETIHFTPWLAENLSALAAELGVELQLPQTEAYGYGGYTDILAEVAGGGKVVIENQLELSDNDHFVRLVGYAADHDAKIIIWVAPQFDEYHQRLLGWLDQALGDDRTIHAVQVKLVPGGDLRSPDADPEAPGFRAEFSRVPLRNNWPQWSTLTRLEPSELNQRYRDFFQTMIGDLRRKRFTDRARASAGNNQSFPTDFAGISYNVGFWNSGGKPSLDVYLWIAANETARNKQIFDGLSGYQDEIEGELSGVTWDRRNNMRMCSIYFSRGGPIASPEEDLTELRKWAVDRLVRLRDAFEPRLKKVMHDLQSNEPERAGP